MGEGISHYQSISRHDGEYLSVMMGLTRDLGGLESTVNSDDSNDRHDNEATVTTAELQHGGVKVFHRVLTCFPRHSREVHGPQVKVRARSCSKLVSKTSLHRGRTIPSNKQHIPGSRSSSHETSLAHGPDGCSASRQLSHLVTQYHKMRA